MHTVDICEFTKKPLKMRSAAGWEFKKGYVFIFLNGYGRLSDEQFWKKY